MGDAAETEAVDEVEDEDVQEETDDVVDEVDPEAYRTEYIGGCDSCRGGGLWEYIGDLCDYFNVGVAVGAGAAIGAIIVAAIFE